MADKSVEGRAALADCLALVACLACAGLGAALLVASDSAGLAFHGLLLLVGSLAALGCVVEFSFDSLRRLPTGYMDGPIKVATIAAVIWGIAGFVVGDLIAWQLAFPALNLDLPWTSFGRLRPLHTSAVIFAFGGNVLLATSLLCRAAHLPCALARPLGALVRGLGLPAVHADRRHRLPARHHAEQGIRRARMVRGPLADDRVGRLSGWCSSAPWRSARSRTSTWRTGSIWLSSSPSPCCTSSTTRRSPSA